MSATRDQSQKITFVYQNLHQLYTKGKAAAQAAPEVPMSSEPVGLTKGKILKADDVAAHSVRVDDFKPAEFIGKRIEKPAVLQTQRNEAVESLKSNLKNLKDLHARLRFMLQELEDLTKK